MDWPANIHSTKYSDLCTIVKYSLALMCNCCEYCVNFLSASRTRYWKIEAKKQTFSTTRKGDFTLHESVAFKSEKKNTVS